MTQKRVDINTCVWGEWHLNVMQRVMLPTLLSPANLPALTRRFPSRYRIATTPADRKSIESWPIFALLAATVEIEWITDNASPEITYHIAWYERSLVDAKTRNSYCFMAYPDVAWSDGTLARCADAIVAGDVGVAIPYIRVISETLVPDVARLGTDSAIALSGGEIVRLGMRHMHPLSAAAMAGGRHALPSLDVSWRVPDQGLLLREMSRELSMVDTERLQANRYWNTVATANSGSLYVVADSDDMLMLSVAPLFKDFQVYIPNHPLQPMDLARVSLHPTNNNPLVKQIATHPIRLHYEDFDAIRWRKFERRAEHFVGQALFMREFIGIWEAARAAGCSLSSRAMSIGLLTTPLASRWRYDGPVTAYIPTDDAFGPEGWEALAPLLAPDRAQDLKHIILKHVIRGVRFETSAGPWQETTLGGLTLHGRTRSGDKFVNEAKVVRQLDVGYHQICFIDQLLVPIDATAGRCAVGPPLDSRPESRSYRVSTDDISAIAGFREATPSEMSAPRNFFKFTKDLYLAASASSAKVYVESLRRAVTWRRGFPTELVNDEGIASHYRSFLEHFGIRLEIKDLKRQKHAAAVALYQAGLYRHKLLFLYDLMKQFETSGGAIDPRPAFFDLCSSLIGGEEELMRAVRYYRLALLLLPDFAEALYSLGVLERRVNATNEAMRFFEAAAIAPAHPNAVTHAHIAANSWRNLAEMHRDLGNDETAEACFRKALHHHGIHGVYQAEIAEFLRAHGHIAEAAQQYGLTIPYTHLYPSEFSEPNYPLEEQLPLDPDGKPCDPLLPTVVAGDANGRRILYWWHLYFLVPPERPLDAVSLVKMKPEARLRL